MTQTVPHAHPTIAAAAADGAAVGGAAGAHLVVEGLSKSYRQRTVVDGLDLTLRRGELLALLGPSGCGKTTTLRMLGGFETPDAGRVLLDGREITAVPAHHRDVHTVFQSYALFPHLSVFDNVAFPLRQRGVDRRQIAHRVGEALEQVSLADAARQRPAELSGGQAQRTALARALIDRPSLLLLDEPLAALDKNLRQHMQVELRMLQRRLGVTTVLVTHDQEEALALADRIAVMHQGQLLQVSTPDELYDNPGSEVVARFVGEQNIWHGVHQPDGSVRCPAVTLLPDPGAAAAAVTRSAQGQPVVAMVRPEHVDVDVDPGDRVADPRDQAPNQLCGTVAISTALGPLQQLVVSTPAGEVLARLVRRRGTHPLVGDRVRCSWPAAAIRLFPAPPQESR